MNSLFRQLKGPLLAAYVVLGLLTLVFQIYVRTGPCTAAGDCATSYAKAVVWSVIWPARWFVYLTGPYNG